ncbi:sulfatase-like hydrolase/transferase [Haloplanus halophilus]|uniref:sulfatase-like hydrolase/transferase n=1 Tax=Haloplanus halophilus TaxID=2949993 RepID=UPI0020412A44|nr:sulfatase-like hydrolase/transferase [Haloplanus sp. GDY1]
MAAPHVFVLVGDCLRAANATAATLPSLTGRPAVEFTRCYTPGTWTKPSHASLYSGRLPVDHGVTRRGDVLSGAQASLPDRARDAGYRTALFSENPTFSARTGFHHGVDYVDDSIHRKPVRSAFSPDHHVDDVDVGAALTLLREVSRRPNRVANLANLAYGLVTELSGVDETAFPHHGRRVIDHLDGFVARHADRPLFCLVNLLDTHNPHHAPPDAGAAALGLSVPDDERRALAAANDDRRYLLERAPLPAATRDHFESWDAVFARRERIYDAQIRHLDHLIGGWLDGLPDRVRDESLVVVTGDHGQLFGEEGGLGHQTSLHPHGIHVPLYVLPPASWETGRGVDTPVSWLGLSRALDGVVDGRVRGTDAFVDAAVEGSRTDGRVVVCADGPTWSVADLRGRYDREAVDAVCVRKVGFVDDDAMTVYESRWAEPAVRRLRYDLADGSRTLREEADDATPPDRYAAWLRRGGEAAVSAATSARLRRLGYL